MPKTLSLDEFENVADDLFNQLVESDLSESETLAALGVLLVRILSHTTVPIVSLPEFMAWYSAQISHGVVTHRQSCPDIPKELKDESEKYPGGSSDWEAGPNWPMTPYAARKSSDEERH